MLKASAYSVKDLPESSASVSSTADSRYSIFTSSPLLSDASTVTVCVSLKNSPKVILFSKVFHLFVPTLISPVGFSVSFHCAVIVMFSAGIVCGISLSQPLKA